MKLLPAPIKNSKGFTLIELIVVIAILGVLAAVLITVIDPLDKIKSANDAGVISAVAQFGKAEDSYAATHNNLYAGQQAGAFSGATSTLNDLFTAGEIKSNAYTPPSGYAISQLLTTGCTTGGPTTCANYVFYTSAVSPSTTGLLSKKNVSGTPPSGGPFYMWANGKGCYVAAAPTVATATCP